MYFRLGSWKLRDLLLNDPRREFLNSEVEKRRLDVEGPVCQVSISLVELRNYQREKERERRSKTEWKRRGIENLSTRRRGKQRDHPPSINLEIYFEDSSVN